jgi:hypothetical protein
MYFLLFLILLLAVIVYSLFDKLSVLEFQFDTNRDDMHLFIYWLYPLFMAKVEMSNYSPRIHLYFFKMRIYSKGLKKKAKQNQKSSGIIQLLEFQDSHAVIYYGFKNPFETGIATGVIEFLRSIVSNISISQFPDFIPDHEYLVVQAGSKLNIGITLVRYIRMQFDINKTKRSNQYGSVQYG